MDTKKLTLGYGEEAMEIGVVVFKQHLLHQYY